VPADQGKLPDFIKRLEEALYKTAKSRVRLPPRLSRPAAVRSDIAAAFSPTNHSIQKGKSTLVLLRSFSRSRAEVMGWG
jgi:hypothetical protein